MRFTRKIAAVTVLIGLFLGVLPVPRVQMQAEASDLPQYYGLYIMEKGEPPSEMKDTGSGALPGHRPNIEFLLYDPLAKLAYGSLKLARMKFVRHKIDYRKRENGEVTVVNEWDLVFQGDHGSPFIELRYAPVPDQPEMVRIIPAEPLQPGYYAAFPGRLVQSGPGGLIWRDRVVGGDPAIGEQYRRRSIYAFTVNKGRINRDADCIDMTIGDRSGSAVKAFEDTFVKGWRTSPCSANPGTVDVIVESCADAYRLSKRGECAKAVSLRAACLKTQPNNTVRYNMLLSKAKCFSQTCDFRSELEGYNEAIRLAPARSWAYLAKAWVLATAPDPEIRDGEEALAAALKGVQFMEAGQTGNEYDILAAAYAEAGRFEDAVRAQLRAIKEAPRNERVFGQVYYYKNMEGNWQINTHLHRNTKMRLEMYRAGRPYRAYPHCTPNTVLFVDNGKPGLFRFGVLIKNDDSGGLSLVKEKASDADLIHAGLDIVAPRGSEIRSPVDGWVVDVIDSPDDPDFARGLGYAVILLLDEKILGKPYYALFLHMDEPSSLRRGKRVSKGETLLGRVGDSGKARGTHVHVEIRDFKSRYLEDPNWNSPLNIYGNFTEAAEGLLVRHWIDPEAYFARDSGR